MAEFSIIDRYCQGLGVKHPETKLGIGDDAAVICVPDNMDLAISVDTMVEGVHFHAGTDPADLAHKLLAVNLSDMAAMGAQAKWVTLTLTTPTYQDDWLAEFSNAMNSMAKSFRVQLIGGDTTQGPLNLSIQIMGLLPLGKSLKRSGAKIGDAVYVSNTLGDAALALRVLANGAELSLATRKVLYEALHRPIPQCELGLGLLDLANSCIDISDGLVADLEHIARQSNVSIELDVEHLPLSSSYREVLSPIEYDLALTGGDDYQLAFTVAPSMRARLEAFSASLDLPIALIGRVVEMTDSAINLRINNKPYVLRDNAGYQHFT